MSLDYAALLRTFIAEHDDGLHRTEEQLLALEAGGYDAERLAEVFRGMHTLKGDAGSLGFPRMAAVAHRLEDVLEDLRQREEAPSPALLSALFGALDLLRELLHGAAQGEEPALDSEPVLARVVAAWQASRDVQRPGGATTEGAVAVPGAAGRWGTETLRIPVARLDALLDLSGELRTARSRLGLALRTPTTPRNELIELHEEGERLYAQLQELVTELRLVPVGPLFRRYLRPVRDLAFAHGKEARVVLEGEDVEVDTRVVELLRDPLIHLVRNAVDHGLETPEVRRAAGKPGTGTLRLAAAHRHGSVVITVADDGAGIDRARVVVKARDLGLLGPQDEPTPEAIDRLVLASGFSTAAALSDVSGRGVGLDVVRERVERLRGSLDITSRPGEGTCITLRLPLTLAMIDGFRVGVAGEVFVVPLEHLVETLELPANTAAGAATGVLLARDRVLPWVRLRTVFGLGRGEAASRREFVAVVEDGAQRFGLVVDELFGQEQSVVKRLAPLFRGLSSFAGSTLLGDGRVALILDVPGLVPAGVASVPR